MLNRELVNKLVAVVDEYVQLEYVQCSRGETLWFCAACLGLSRFAFFSGERGAGP